ncbi:MAG: glycosyltransferase [Bacteroides sp.]|nr:glycosyltransferase [Bacteroides sp.]MCM1447170.1 glycosyltransferase [Bacteroides sp.]
MKIVFYSVVLNQHQAPVADVLWELTGHQYTFVELINLGDTKGGTEDFSRRPYLLRAWDSTENNEKAMELAMTADCCIFSGVASLPYMKVRMRLGLLSFDMGERWMKHGWKNILSPALSRMLLAYWIGYWKNKPIYKLCCSAFCAGDHYKLGMYKGKCYKWGYFTKVNKSKFQVPSSKDVLLRLMWCARFLKLKHPELPVIMAARLKDEGYSFILDYYGSGNELDSTRQLAEKLQVSDVVKFHGSVPNNQVIEAMRQHDIFLFTSNRLEGWGAVVNEAMSNGCAVVGSDAIGSVPYLVKDGVTGLRFKSDDVDSLYEKVKWLILHPIELKQMQRNAVKTMQEVWSPENAAKSLLKLIEELKFGLDTSIIEGPCSKA